MNENSAKINEYIEMEKTLLKMYKSSNNVSKSSIYTLKNHLNQGIESIYQKRNIYKKYILKVWYMGNT